jgi:hypothetical protein
MKYNNKILINLYNLWDNKEKYKNNFFNNKKQYLILNNNYINLIFNMIFTI